MSLDALDLRKSALLVIDLQNAFCHPEGTLGLSGVDTDRLGAVIEPLKTLIGAFQEAGAPVVWTLQQHREDDARRARKRLLPHTGKRKKVSALAGTWDAEIVDELKPLAEHEGSHLVAKHRFGAFHNTRLHILLEQMGVDALFVTGLTTNACVETSIREAYLHDYDVIAVEDCIGGVNEAWETQAKKVWGQYFCEFASSREVADWIEAQQRPHAAGIHHIALQVSDFERARDFYVEQLGFTPRKNAKPLDERPFVALEQGLGITTGGPGDGRQVDHFAFAVENVDALNARLKKAGVTFVKELGPGPYGRAIYVEDPDGNTLELFELE